VQYTHPCVAGGILGKLVDRIAGGSREPLITSLQRSGI
jgi:hypothetical protein